MLRRWLPWVLFAVLAVPMADLLSLVWLFRAYGAWALGLPLAAAAFGIFILKTWRLTAAWALLDHLRAGQLPLGRLFWIGRTLVAAVLFIFPGIFSDLLGIILILPWPGHRTHYAPPKDAPKDDVLEGEFTRASPSSSTQAGIPRLPPDNSA